MQVLVQRFDANPYCTRASWLIDGVHQCYGMELPLTALVPGGLSALAAGHYKLIVNQSTRFSALAGHPVILPLVLDLAGLTTIFNGRALNDCGIRQHGGNVVNSIPEGQPGGPKPGRYDVNDPHRTDSIGCMLAGSAWGADNRSTTGSRDALAPYIAKLLAAQNRKETIFLTITNPLFA